MKVNISTPVYFYDVSFIFKLRSVALIAFVTLIVFAAFLSVPINTSEWSYCAYTQCRSSYCLDKKCRDGCVNDFLLWKTTWVSIEQDIIG